MTAQHPVERASPRLSVAAHAVPQSHNASPPTATALQTALCNADSRGMLTKRTTVIVCALIGVTLELGIHVLTGRREAWDAGEYWSLGLPLALCASTAVGIFARDTDWRWTAIVAPSQVFTMMVRSGEIGTLFPLTLMLSAIFSLPFLGAAFLGSRVRRRLPLGLH